jgi:hypothetical protein
VSRRARRAAARMLTLALPAVLALAGPPSATAAGFKPVSTAALPSAAIFDLGVLAHDGSRRLSPFTINHKFPSAVLIGGRDRTAEIGLSPTPEFPGFEQLHRTPELGRPGLYLYARDRPGHKPARLFLRAHEGPASGQLFFTTKAVRVFDSAAAEVRKRRTDSGLVRIRFSIAAGGFANLELSNLDLPIWVRDAEQPTFVGADAVRSSTPDFRLDLRDRHSYAAADFDGDGAPDLFIASGGHGGGIWRFRGVVQDELLLNRGGVLRAGERQLDKGLCRGRDAAAPDINTDGRADIFVSCQEAKPQVYLQGGWRMRKLPAPAEFHRWANVDSDPAIELLAVSERRLVVYHRGRRKQYAVRLNGNAAAAPVVADLFERGRPVIFVPSRHHSTVVVGRRALDPRDLGLPKEAGAAAVVDFDNDGYRDLHLGRHGIYRQTSPRSFERTGRLKIRGKHVALNWADLDNDGRRDLLALSGRRAFIPKQRARQWMNRTRGGRWLAVDAPQAMLGDRIVVRAGGRRRVGWVGESEGSHFSDTHRRVYFGLASAKRARVTLRPAHGKAKRRTTRTNRLIRIR